MLRQRVSRPPREEGDGGSNAVVIEYGGGDEEARQAAEEGIRLAGFGERAGASSSPVLAAVNPKITRYFGVPCLIRLRDSPVTLGRSTDSDVVLDSDKLPRLVSRQHAVIDRRRGSDGTEEWFITDKKSVNGIMVNERPVSEEKLTDGCTFCIGKMNVDERNHKIKKTPFLFRFIASQETWAEYLNMQHNPAHASSLRRGPPTILSRFGTLSALEFSLFAVASAALHHTYSMLGNLHFSAAFLLFAVAGFLGFFRYSKEPSLIALHTFFRCLSMGSGFMALSLGSVELLYPFLHIPLWANVSLLCLSLVLSFLTFFWGNMLYIKIIQIPGALLVLSSSLQSFFLRPVSPLRSIGLLLFLGTLALAARDAVSGKLSQSRAEAARRILVMVAVSLYLYACILGNQPQPQFQSVPL